MNLKRAAKLSAAAALIAVFAGGTAFAGGLSSGGPTRVELYAHAGISACALVTEARHLGRDPWLMIPTDARICSRFLANVPAQ